MGYLFAVVFLNFATTYVGTRPNQDENFEMGTTFFSSMGMTLLTLIMSILGGVSWWDVEKVFLEISPFCAVLLVLYVALMMLALLNIVTGIFVNDSIEVAQSDRDIRTFTELSRKRHCMEELQSIFHEIDHDGSGTITYDEFKSAISKDEVHALFETLGLGISDDLKIFKALDIDGNSHLEIEEFVMGCLSLRGTATAVDMENLRAQHKRMMQRSTTQLGKVYASTQESVTIMRSIRDSLPFLTPSVWNSVVQREHEAGCDLGLETVRAPALLPAATEVCEDSVSF